MSRNFDGLKCEPAIRDDMKAFRESPLMNKYKAVIHYLYSNLGQRFKSTHLEDGFSLTSREVQLITRHARRCGHPLMSGVAGYWMEPDPIEMMECANSLRNRALDILETVHFMEKAATRKQHWNLWSRMVQKNNSQLELKL